MVAESVISYSIWLVLVGIAVAIIYFLFIWEKYIDATREIFKNISSECKVSNPLNLRNLVLAGDKEHKEVVVGPILGYSLRENFKKDKDSFQKEDCFLVRKATRGFLGMIMSLFSPLLIVRSPVSMRDILQGDIHLKCVSLVSHGLYFYPNTVHLDFDMIDETIYKEGVRFIQLDFISRISPLINRSVGLRKSDLVELEGKKGLEMIQDIKK